MIISLIGAMGKNRELGFGNKLPWYLPDDLKRFKNITRGHTVIMGRKTFESLGKPLPERKNIIITRNPGYTAEGCTVVDSLERALEEAGDDESKNEEKEVFVIGGAEIYKLALSQADKMYLTFVDAEREADAFFPEFDESDWHIAQTEPHGADEKHPYPFVYKVYERTKR